jgi:hypothetical protein
MKRIIACLALLLLVAPAALAQNNIDSVPVTLNKAAHVKALVRSDRAPRAWFLKWHGVPIFVGKAVPGKETTFYYEWILEDGTTVTKVENVRLEHVPDHREVNDKHPNAPAMQILSLLLGNLLGNLVGGAVQ